MTLKVSSRPMATVDHDSNCPPTADEDFGDVHEVLRLEGAVLSGVSVADAARSGGTQSENRLPAPGSSAAPRRADRSTAFTCLRVGSSAEAISRTSRRAIRTASSNGA